MTQAPALLQCLKNPRFARLYLAQTINLVGDALTWLGLALLAFELAGEKAGIILSGALTLRVMAFVVLSPIAGVLADRFDRKRIMVITHLFRMVIVCLLPFVTQAWQIYAIVLALNVFYAFFTPTYTATIPLVTARDEYPNAIALSSATYQLLGVLGPGLAGSIAAFVGIKQVFFLDGLTFLIAAILLITLPGQLTVIQSQQEPKTVSRTLQDIRTGTVCLFSDPPIRYALIMQLVAAITGAQILVNTVGYVQGTLNLGKVEYGWVMAAFGIGATIASVSLSNSMQRYQKTALIGTGVILLTLSLLPANFASLEGLLLLWLVAGAGQTLVNLPTQTLIADRVAVEIQGRVYGAHFAWSHLWWAFSYPLAGWMGSHFPAYNFLYSGLISAALLIVVYFALNHTQRITGHNGLWHQHEHMHDDEHQHSHPLETVAMQSHRHLHFHSSIHQEPSH
ncbi:MAG: MFS transporter [Alkalinema sp. CAN_BIN05]|nr:MFS transporter [Alkalinema sp. CAN_BIN05]